MPTFLLVARWDFATNKQIKLLTSFLGSSWLGLGAGQRAGTGDVSEEEVWQRTAPLQPP